MMLRRFIIRLALYCIPVFMPLLLVVGLAIYSGEAMPLRWVIQLQSGTVPILYQTLDIDRTFAYKVMATEYYQPNLVFIGSSRMGQFGSSLATEEGAVFYNAHGISWGTWQAWQYIEALPDDALPEVIIVDFYLIQFPAEAPPTQFDTSLADLNTPFIFTRTTRLVNRIRDGYVSPLELFQREGVTPDSIALGSLAIEQGQGYWNDGSWQVSLNTDRQTVFDNSLQAVMRTSRNFSTTIAAARLDEVEQLLQAAQSHNVEVIGLVTPYAPILYNTLGANDWITPAVTGIAMLFEQYEQPFFDFSHIESIPDASVADMRDIVHSSRELSLRMYIEMVQTLPELLEQYSDVETLQARLENER
jgi:hypothetical protein